MLCGASPIPASSGKTTRHRLNRGGNRDADSALHMIIVPRAHRPYVARRLAEGKSKREIMRCLKRDAARETYRALTTPVSLGSTGDAYDTPSRSAISRVELRAVTSHVAVADLPSGARLDREVVERPRRWQLSAQYILESGVKPKRACDRMRWTRYCDARHLLVAVDGVAPATQRRAAGPRTSARAAQGATRATPGGKRLGASRRTARCQGRQRER